MGYVVPILFHLAGVRFFLPFGYDFVDDGSVFVGGAYLYFCVVFGDLDLGTLFAFDGGNFSFDCWSSFDF